MTDFNVTMPIKIEDEELSKANRSDIITKEFLESKGACREQLEILFTEFPNGGEVTLGNCLRAAALNIDFDWAADKLLSTTARKAYLEAKAKAPAQKAYDEAKAPARKAYDEAIAPTWKVYDEVMATARKAYLEAKAPSQKAYDEAIAPERKAYLEARATAWKVYKEATAPAWKVYKEATAPAFYQSWLVDHPNTAAAIAAAKEGTK